MASPMRKHDIDNLRWMMLLILIPYHAAQAWNTWGEPNYIFLEGNRWISSIIVFFAPYFMPLLFVLAGISARFSLQKRTRKEYLAERVKRLLVPFLFGTIALMPILSYIGDQFNCSYSGGFFKHYGVFFTKWTDFTGADGGFSVGQFWFLLYLFVISVVSVPAWPKKWLLEKAIPFWLVLALGLPLPLFCQWLSIGGKSLVEYTYCFLLGYAVLASENVAAKLEKARWPLFGVGLAATVLNVAFSLWFNQTAIFLQTIVQSVSKWFMVLALLGLARRYLNFTGKVSNYMNKRSFLFYTYHFIWVVLFQSRLVGSSTCISFFGTVLFSCLAAFACCEISIRIPVLCFLTGTKPLPR